MKNLKIGQTQAMIRQMKIGQTVVVISAEDIRRFCMKIMKCVLVLALVSCGNKSKSTTLPNVTSADLHAQIERVTPLLNWCDGQAAGASPNNMDHRPNCDVGDAMAESGFLTLVGNFSNESTIFASMAASFGADGQPFRAPSYVGKDTQDEFSRDQLLGLVAGTVAGLPAGHLQTALDYYKRTHSLCPHPTDTRCLVTPSLMVRAKSVLGHEPTKLEATTDKAVMLAEAASVPLTYQAGLLANHIFVIARQNKLTVSYAKAINILWKRAPQNLWLSTVNAVCNRGTAADFDAIAQSLLTCLKSWTAPGTDWTFSHGNEVCRPNARGHELVALAHFLMKVDVAPKDPNDGAPVIVATPVPEEIPSPQPQGTPEFVP